MPFHFLNAEYGVTASELHHADCGFIGAYEKPNMMLRHQDVYQIFFQFGQKRIKELGADAVKILLLL